MRKMQCVKSPVSFSHSFHPCYGRSLFIQTMNTEVCQSNSFHGRQSTCKVESVEVGTSGLCCDLLRSSRTVKKFILTMMVAVASMAIVPVTQKTCDAGGW